MLFSRLFSALFITSTLVSPLAMALEPLPDSLDVTKYQSIYLNAKRESDSLRGQANSLYSSASSIDARINEIENQISSQERDIRNHQQSIINYADEIRSLRSQNFNLDSEINRLSNLIRINNVSWQNLQRNEAALLEDLRRLDRDHNQAERRAQNLQEKIRDVHQQIRDLEAQIAKKREQAKNLQQSSQQKDRESDQAAAKAQAEQAQLANEQSKLSNLESRLSNAEADSAQAAQKAQNEAAQVPPLRNALQSARQALQAEQAKVAPLAAKVQSAEREVRQSEQQLARQTDQLANISRRLDAKQAELAKLKQEPTSPEIEAQIAAVQAEVTQLEGKKSQAASEVSAAETKLNTDKAELASAKSELQNAEAQLPAFVADVAAKKSAVDAAEAEAQKAQNEAQAASARVLKIRTEIVETKTDIVKLQRSIPELQARAQTLKQQSAQEQAQAVVLHNEAKALDDLSDDRKKIAQRLMGEKAQVDRELAQIDGAISDVRSRLAPVQAEMERLRVETERYAAIIQSSQNQMAQNSRAIEERQVWTDQLEGRISQLTASNRDLARELSARREQSAQAWNDYGNADAKAKAAESVTAQHRSQYLAVKGRFDALMVEAQNLGSSQGAPLGSKDGIAQGQLDGTAVGKQEGEIKGTADGLKYGFDLGQKQGAANGKAEGYAHGKNLPQNYADGKALGLAQGEKDAIASAQAKEYPAARAAVRKAKTAKPPTNTITVDNKAVAENTKKSASDVALGSRDAGMVEKAVAFLEKQGKEVNANSLNGGVLLGLNSETMSAVELKNTIEIESVVSKTERNFETLLARMEVNMSAAKCEQKYDVFVQGCLDAYRSAYTQAYQKDYKSTHATAKAQAYELAYNATFEANKMVRYKEGYDPAYQSEYTKWDTIGANEARAQGYTDGKKEGFDGKIVEARKAATEAGTKDETDLFDNSSVVAMLDAMVAKPSAGVFTAGDKFSLQVKFANYGGQPSKRGEVKVSWESLSSDIVTEDAVSQIVAIPGYTTATVKSVAYAKVGINAGEQETHKIRVRAVYADGTFQEKIVSVTTRLLITPSSAKSFDAQPNAKGILGYYTHDVKVTVKNPTSVTALQDINVYLSSAKSADVEFKIGAATAGKLKGGEAKTLKLQYKFKNKNVVGKAFPFTLKTYYGKELVNTESFSVTPK